MPRAFTNNTPDDVLETFRRIITGENSEEASPPRQVSRVQAAQVPDVASDIARGVAIVDAEEHTPTVVAGADPGPSNMQASRQGAVQVERSSGLFVDRIATRLSFPAGAGSSPVLREDVQNTDGEQVSAEDAGPEAPMLLTRALAVSPGKAKGQEHPEELASTEPKLCKLLLTSDFQVRGPVRTRLPHPVALLARDDYVEDSDLSIEGGAVADMTPAAAALREAVGQALRSALRTEVGTLVDEPQSVPETRAASSEDGIAASDTCASGALVSDDTPLVINHSGHIDADMLQGLVANIVRDELRGDLGDEMSRRMRKLVRLEINRMLQVRALD